MAKKSTGKQREKTPQAEKKAVMISTERLRKFAKDLHEIADTVSFYAEQMESLHIAEVKDFVKGIVNGIKMADNWSQTFTTALSKAIRERGGRIQLKITPPEASNGTESPN